MIQYAAKLECGCSIVPIGVDVEIRPCVRHLGPNGFQRIHFNQEHDDRYNERYQQELEAQGE